MLLNIFTRETLVDDFWGLQKNMNCAFPLTKQVTEILRILENILCRWAHHPEISVNTDFQHYN